ncbi:hypothetical protein [Jannaschia marina]|uniref:hypothetical protein n=1 Tax=Jannaschia marina TaxID=2741674 RepID=UPI0015CDD435|nr:hypothetical protein [Jannaschia marina]
MNSNEGNTQELLRDLHRINAEVIKESGLFALKTLITLNGGGIIAVFAFLGSALREGTFEKLVSLSDIKWATGLFVLGIVAAIASLATTYILAQLQFTVPRTLERIGSVGFIGAMVFPAALSIVFFTCGAFTAINAVSPQ